MNRKQRRQAAAFPSTSPHPTLSSANDIPLSQPDRSGSAAIQTKTLYEIAAEKQAELLPNSSSSSSSTTKLQPGGSSTASDFINVKIGVDGKVVTEDGKNPLAESRSKQDTESVPPWLDTLFLASSLSAIHFTLETLTVHQYAQELRFAPIVKHTFLVAFPTLVLLIHLFHGHLLGLPVSSLSGRAKQVGYILLQLAYVGIANVAGCYLIWLTNDKGYYAVMKNAPSVGTIWVWAVIELGLAGALAGVAGPGLYAWWYGYGIFN